MTASIFPRASKIIFKRLVAQKIIFEARGEIEAVIQWRDIGQASIVEEVAQEAVFVFRERMVKLKQEVVIVAVAGGGQLLRRKAEVLLELVDAGQVLQDHRVIKRVFAPPLSFIVAEKESAIFAERAAERESKLVLAQLVEVGRRQDAGGVQGIIAKIFIKAAVQVIGSALGHDVDDAAHGAAGLHDVSVVDDQELTHSFL